MGAETLSSAALITGEHLLHSAERSEIARIFAIQEAFFVCAHVRKYMKAYWNNTFITLSTFASRHTTVNHGIVRVLFMISYATNVIFK